MTIDGIPFNYPSIEQLRKNGPQIEHPDSPSSGAEKGSSFQEALSEALNEINRLSGKADGEIQNLVSGRTQSPHDAMIAMEKADVAFQLMNAVRTKIVRAYEEIMRTQV
jgi:flagellar hook-basal body complex protein FliE